MEDARPVTIRQWQECWESEIRGMWTVRFIYSITELFVHLPLLQPVFTEHGYFNSYLACRMMQKVELPASSYLDSGHECPFHTFFECKVNRRQRGL